MRLIEYIAEGRLSIVPTSNGERIKNPRMAKKNTLKHMRIKIFTTGIKVRRHPARTLRTFRRRVTKNIERNGLENLRRVSGRLSASLNRHKTNLKD